MKRLICAVIALAALPSLAQRHTVVQEPDRVVPLKKQTIDFSEVAVGGEYQRPAGTYMLGKPKPGFAILIKVRGSFAPELQKSADQL